MYTAYACNQTLLQPPANIESFFKTFFRRTTRGGHKSPNPKKDPSHELLFFKHNNGLSFEINQPPKDSQLSLPLSFLAKPKTQKTGAVNLESTWRFSGRIHNGLTETRNSTNSIRFTKETKEGISTKHLFAWNECGQVSQSWLCQPGRTTAPASRPTWALFWMGQI